MADQRPPFAENTFGSYLRSLRQEHKLSLREVARALQITPTYLSDLERGNNRPPDKVLLEKIIHVLQLEQDEEACQNLLDLAARERNDLPADIKDYLMDNRTLQSLIRKIYKHKDTETICQQMLQNLS